MCIQCTNNFYFCNVKYVQTKYEIIDFKIKYLSYGNDYF